MPARLTTLVTKTKISPANSLGLGLFPFTLVFLLRLFALSRFAGSPLSLPHGGDMAFYDAWAHRILGSALTDGHAFYALPLYAYWLAAIHAVFGAGGFVPGLLQGLADAGTALLLYKIVVQLLSSSVLENSVRSSENLGAKVTGTLCALTWAFYLPAQAFSIVQMPTTLGVFVFWLVVWQIIKRTEPPRFVVYFLLGLLVGVTAMGIATILVLVPLLFAALIWRWQLRSSRLTLSFVILLSGVFLGTGPCWLHNYFIAHDRVFLSAHSGINFWIGNNPAATGYPSFGELRAGQAELLQDSIALAEAAAGKPLPRSAVSAFWSAKARAYIASDFGGWLRLLGMKLWNFWNAFQYDDLSIVARLREQGVIFPGPRFGIIAAFALAGLPWVLRSSPSSRWIAAAVGLQMLSLLPVFVTERYRLAAVPGLVILGGLGIRHLWESCALGRFRTVAIHLALLGVAALLVSKVPANPALWALDPYNAGRAALDAGDLAVAQQKLELAYSYVPQNAELNLALGNLWQKRGDTARARTFYRATLETRPRHKAALNNLGVLALDEGQGQIATEFFQEALAASPNDSKTHYLLARASLELGDTPRAEREIDAALSLEPGRSEYQELAKAIRERR